MAAPTEKENANPNTGSAPPARPEGASGSGLAARTDGAGGSGSGLAARPDGANPSTSRSLAALPLPSTAGTAEELADILREMAIKDPSCVAMKTQLTELQPFLSAREKALMDPQELIDEFFRLVPVEARYHVSKAWEVSGQSSTDPAVPRRCTPTQQHLFDTILGAALARATDGLSNPLPNLPRTYSIPSAPNAQKKYQRVSYGDAALFVDPDRRSMSPGQEAPGRAALRDLELFCKSHNYEYKGKGELLMHAAAIALKSPEAPAMKAWLDTLIDKDPEMTYAAFCAAWTERWASEVRSREARARDQLLTGRVRQSGNSLTDYVGAYRGVMLELPDMHESDRIRLFIQGMDLHYRKWCACDFAGLEFTTLNAAITHALGVERRNTLASNAANHAVPIPDPAPTPNKFQRRPKRRFAVLQGKRARSEAAPMSISDPDSDGDDGAGPSNPRFAVTKVNRKKGGGGGARKAKGGPKPKAMKSVKTEGETFKPDSTPEKKASTSAPPAKKPRKGDPNALSHIHFTNGRKLKMKDVWRCYDEGYCFNCFKQGHRSSECPAPPKQYKDGR